MIRLASLRACIGALGIGFLFLAFTSFAQNEDDSFVKFRIKNAGINVDGAFEIFSSKIDYNKEDPSKSNFKAVIQVSSINTGIDLRDKDLKKKEYFDVSNYPVIKFVSTSVLKLDQNRIKVEGNLTIRNVTKKVAIEVKIVSGAKVIYTGSLRLNRRDFGVGGNSWMLSDELTVNIKVVK